MNGCERRYSLLGGFIGAVVAFGWILHRFTQPRSEGADPTSTSPGAVEYAIRHWQAKP